MALSSLEATGCIWHDGEFDGFIHQTFEEEDEQGFVTT